MPFFQRLFDLFPLCMILILTVDSVGITEDGSLLVDLRYTSICIDVVHLLEILASQQVNGLLDIGCLLPCVLPHDPVSLIVDNTNDKCIGRQKCQNNHEHHISLDLVSHASS